MVLTRISITASDIAKFHIVVHFFSRKLNNIMLEICKNVLNDVGEMGLLHAAGICDLTTLSRVKFREKHDNATSFFQNQLQAQKKLLKLRP